MTRLSQNLKKEIKKLHNSQGRKKSSFYIIEGLRCCQEALEKLPTNDIFAIITSESENNSENGNNLNYNANKKFIVSDKDFANLSQTQNPQGIMILARKIQQSALNFCDDFLLVLDRIQDPGNIGTILRTAVAVGLTEIALTNGTVDPFNSKAIRAGMGAQFSLKFNFFENIKELSNDTNIINRKIWLTTPHDGISCYDSNFCLKDSILVFGEEANGIQDFSIGEKTMIPTLTDIESLNVAQAATVYLFESLRQRLGN